MRHCSIINHPLVRGAVVALWLFGMVIFVFGVAASEPGSPDRTALGSGAIHDEIVRLREAWCVDPLDESTALRIAELRRTLDHDRSVALRHLVRGLSEFLDGRAHLAAPALSQARGSLGVERLADSALTRRLAELEEQARAAAEAAGLAGRCPRCGDSGLMDCPNPTCWRSFGHLPCGTCRGTGNVIAKLEKPTDVPETCPACGGFALTPCPDCAGNGLLVCDLCHLLLLEELPGKDAVAIHRLRAMATHLALGGPDLYSPGALEASPQIAP